MRVRVLGARDRVVQNGIEVALVFLLTRAPSAEEPNGSVYYQTYTIPLREFDSFISTTIT